MAGFFQTMGAGAQAFGQDIGNFANAVVGNPSAMAAPAPARPTSPPILANQVIANQVSRYGRPNVDVPVINEPGQVGGQIMGGPTGTNVVPSPNLRSQPALYDSAPGTMAPTAFTGPDISHTMSPSLWTHYAPYHGAPPDMEQFLKSTGQNVHVALDRNGTPWWATDLWNNQNHPTYQQWQVASGRSAANRLH